MKKIITNILIFTNIILSQQGTVINKEKIKQLLYEKYNIKVIEIEKDILKLNYPDRYNNLFNIKEYRQPENITGVFDSTVINLMTIDTTQYYNKYVFWQRIPLANTSHQVIGAADINNNNRMELYGYQLINSNSNPVTVYELQENNYFEKIYTYPDEDLIAPRNIYDIDNDNNLEIDLLDTTVTDRLEFEHSYFEKPHNDSLATKLKFTYSPYQAIYQSTFGKFDLDNITDLIYDRANRFIQIDEYNSSSKNFDSIYSFKYSYPDFQNLIGFSVDDFDCDGYTEFVSGDLNGKILIIENKGNNLYDTVWAGQVPTLNAYIHSQTQDFNRNGKPEFWIKGQHFDNQGSKNVISIFEVVGDNEYRIIHVIYLLGVFSWNTGNMQAIDLDGDGIEEMLICIEDNILILKYKGKMTSDAFELFYIQKGNERAFLSSSSYFLLNKSDAPYPELLVTYYNYTEPERSDYTDIYIYNSSVGINNDFTIYTPEISISNNYPNPFNNNTEIKIKVNEETKVSIKVYDILGKEIQNLLNKNMIPGDYNIKWNILKYNKIIPSGVYFIKITAKNINKLLKAVYLK